MGGFLGEINFLECKRASSSCKKRLLEYFEEVDADIFCLQETKLQEGQIELDLPAYKDYWNYAVKKVILVPRFLQKWSRYQFNMV